MISINDILFLIIFFVLNAFSGEKFSGCPNGWIDGKIVSMGCLYFNHSQSLTWFEAAQSCQQGQTGARLIEILTAEVRRPCYFSLSNHVQINHISFSKWTSLRWIFSFSKHR